MSTADIPFEIEAFQMEMEAFVDDDGPAELAGAFEEETGFDGSSIEEHLVL